MQRSLMVGNLMGFRRVGEKGETGREGEEN